MESVQGTKPKEITLFHQGIKKDRKDAVSERYLSIGIEIIRTYIFLSGYNKYPLLTTICP